MCGKCEVVCAEMMDSQEEKDAWFSHAPDRFYFMEVRTHTLDPSVHGFQSGHLGVKMPR